MKKNILITIVVCGALLLGVVAIMQREILPLQVVVNQIFSGQIVSITSGSISTDDGKGGALHPLTTSDALRLGDTILVERGTNATLKLSTPKDSTPDADLIFIKQKQGEQYPINVKIEHQVDNTIFITINS